MSDESPPTVADLDAEIAALQAAEAELEAKPAGPTVTLYVVRFNDGTFVSGVEGVDPITHKGTAVPADKVEAVLERAGYSKVAVGERA